MTTQNLYRALVLRLLILILRRLDHSIHDDDFSKSVKNIEHNVNDVVTLLSKGA
jgi:hypothetical protein